MIFAFIQFSIVAGTALLFLAINILNGWLISELNFIPGISWISLAAGLCVLATLLLGPIGTVGILIAYLLRDFQYVRWVDLPHTMISAVAHAVGPYLVYLIADRLYGLQASLSNLTSSRLLLVIVACSAVCPALQCLLGQVPEDSWAMLNHCLLTFTGNLTGALILTYMLKAVSAVLP